MQVAAATKNYVAEPFGTTPLPTSLSGSPVKVWFDADSTLAVAQQPQAQQIANFEATMSDTLNGNLLDANQQFVVYGVKNGLIRILHRHSTLRSLLRAHKGQQLTDVRFFHDGDVLATVANSAERSSVVIWRVFQRASEISSEILLEVTTTKFTTQRVVWHPFNPNQFWMIHSDANGKRIATLVESTRITTTVHSQLGHAVCDFHEDFVIMQGAVQLSTTGGTAVENGPEISSDGGNYDESSLTDLCWSDRETRHVLSTHDNGEIRLWDLKKLHANANGTVSPSCMACIKDDVNLSRCLFLPLESSEDDCLTPCFITATNQNSEITLWTAFSDRGKPSKLQTLTFEHPSSSYLVDVCSGPAPPDTPPSCFVVLADRMAGTIFAFHLRSAYDEPGKPKKAILVGCDFVVPFQTKYPTYSWSVMSVPTMDVSEDDVDEHKGIIFDIKLFAFQSSVVQSLTLTSYMCLPPSNLWTESTPGVRVEPLQQVPAHVSDVGSDSECAMVYDEDYDVGDVDDMGDTEDDYNNEEYHAPEASSLPSPDCLSSPPSGPILAPLSNNPFANWLGAIASKSTSPVESATPLPSSNSDFRPAASSSVRDLSSLPTVTSSQSDPQLAKVTRVPSPAAPTALLSPMDILSGNKNAVANKSNLLPENKATATRPKKTTETPATNTTVPSFLSDKKQRKKSPRRPAAARALTPEPTKFQILKRETLVASNTSSNPVNNTREIPLPPQPRELPSPSNVISRPVPSSNLTDVSTKSEHPQLSTDDIREVFSHEIGSVFIPQIEKSMRSSLDDSVTKTILAALQDLSIKNSADGGKTDTDELALALSKSVDEPLRAAFVDSMKTVFVPCLESITGQIFAQIATHFDQYQESTTQAAVAAATAAVAKNNNKGPNKDLEAISKQLTTMTTLVAKLTDEVQSLRSIVLAQQENAAAAIGNKVVEDGDSEPFSVSSKKNAIEVIRSEIVELLRREEYEAAFTKAVAASSTELTYFCCSTADINSVLGGTTPSLSQPILLCLMQQLGTVLMSSSRDLEALQLVLDWLQEIALSLQPSDPQIQPHAPGVLQQLVAGISTRMTGGDPVLRRPLQRLLQILRGMTMG